MDAPFFHEFEQDSKSVTAAGDRDSDATAAVAAPAARTSPEQKRAVDSRRASSVRRLTTARDYLRAHFFEDLYLDDLAAAANMSTFHFSRAYRRQFGIAPLADLLEHRVAMAEHLLTTTRLDVSAIATAVGFECRTTLFRQFVRARGRSPLYFRRQARDARRDQRIARPLESRWRGGAMHGNSVANSLQDARAAYLVGKTKGMGINCIGCSQWRKDRAGLASALIASGCRLNDDQASTQTYRCSQVAT